MKVSRCDCRISCPFSSPHSSSSSSSRLAVISNRSEEEVKRLLLHFFLFLLLSEIFSNGAARFVFSPVLPPPPLRCLLLFSVSRHPRNKKPLLRSTEAPPDGWASYERAQSSSIARRGIKPSIRVSRLLSLIAEGNFLLNQLLCPPSFSVFGCMVPTNAPAVVCGFRNRTGSERALQLWKAHSEA